DPYQVANWEYNQNKDIYICPNGQTIHFSHLSNRTDKYGFTRTYKVYESKDCSSCLLRAYCTRTKENNRQIGRASCRERVERSKRDWSSDVCSSDLDPYQVANWEYNQNKDIYICPNGQTIHFSHLSNRTDKYGFTRTYKVYESKDCSSCLLRAYCTRTKENNR